MCAFGLIIAESDGWGHVGCTCGVCLSDKPTHQTGVQGRGQGKRQDLGVISLGVIVKIDISWILVSSCSSTRRNSPLTFKVTVKSIILSSSSINYSLPSKMPKSSLSNGTFAIVDTVMLYLSFKKCFYFYSPGLLHVISLFSYSFIFKHITYFSLCIGNKFSMIASDKLHFSNLYFPFQ